VTFLTSILITVLVFPVITLTLSRLCFRAATAALIEKQSKEMLQLINERKREYIQRGDDEEFEEVVETEYPLQPPAPGPPATDKTQIYADPIEFADIDQIAISVRFRLQSHTISLVVLKP